MTDTRPHALAEIMSRRPEDRPTGELIDDLRALQDERQRLDTQAKAIGKQADWIKRTIIIQLNDSGQTSAATDSMSVSVKEKWRVNAGGIAPDQLMRWALDNDAAHCIQKRVTAATLAKIAAEGTPLPDGLTLETYDDLNTRRR